MRHAEMYEYVRDNIEGRFAQTKEGAILLQLALEEWGGDYIEIGTLYGGSAIMVALMEKGYRVYAIDPLDGYNETGRLDPVTQMTPTRAILERNLRHFDVSISMFQHKHPQFPKALEDFHFGVGLLDGRHDLKPTTLDYNALKDRCDCLVFDNTEVPGVAKVVDRAIAEGWKERSSCKGKMASGNITEMKVLSK